MEQQRIASTTAVRPLLATGAALELDGYPGPASVGLFGVYRDLGLERLVEIPSDGILSISEPSSLQGRVTVLFRAAAQLMYVTKNGCLK